MPSKNKEKLLVEDGIYHAYNRGYNKNAVFRSHHDYHMFRYLLRKYLEPGFKIKREIFISGVEFIDFVAPNHLYEEIDVFAYCLMSNHFHLLIKQRTRQGMSKLMNRVLGSYSRYFGQKYNIIGSAWQGTYKAVKVEGEKQFTRVFAYIHENPAELGVDIETYKYSSASLYSGKSLWDDKWIKRVAP